MKWKPFVHLCSVWKPNNVKTVRKAVLASIWRSIRRQTSALYMLEVCSLNCYLNLLKVSMQLCHMLFSLLTYYERKQVDGTVHSRRWEVGIVSMKRKRVISAYLDGQTKAKNSSS